MKRKLIKQGIGGCTIFLPISWIRTQNLKPGDEIELNIDEDKIIVEGVGKSFRKTKNIDLGDDGDIGKIQNMISSSYKAGYDEMIIHCTNLPKLHSLNKIVESFTGLEITDQTRNILKIRCFLENDASTIEGMIIKLFQTIYTLIEHIKNPVISMEDITDMVTINIKRMKNFITRMIQSSNHGKDHSYEYHSMVADLEKIALDLQRYASYLIASKSLPSKVFLEYSKQFSLVYQAYLKKDFKDLHRLWSSQRDWGYSKDVVAKKPEKKVSAENIYLYSMVNRLRDITTKMMVIFS